MSHSAGAAGNFLAPINQLSPNAFKSVMDIDVLGSYNTLKATLPSLVESAKRTKIECRLSPPPSLTIVNYTLLSMLKNLTFNLLASPSPLGGRIIFISATLHYTGTPLQAHVGVAKAGVDALSNSVAIEFGPRGITSNIIAPGPIAGTEGMERLARKEDAAAGKKQIPLGRWGTVREIADATVYLFSEAAGYVTGTTLVGESDCFSIFFSWLSFGESSLEFCCLPSCCGSFTSSDW